MIKHFKSVNFVFCLIGLLSSLSIIVLAICYRDHLVYLGVGVALLMTSISNFIVYFEKYKKQRKEESASAKLKFKGV